MFLDLTSDAFLDIQYPASSRHTDYLIFFPNEEIKGLCNVRVKKNHDGP
jgi:hypothetical protein